MGVTAVFDHRTELRVGAGCWREAVPAVAALGRQVLLVTGSRTLDRLGLSSELTALFAAAGCRLTTVTVAGEPDTLMADAAAAAARRGHCQVVCAIGGGSVIDVAKAAAGLAVNAGGAIDYLEGLPQPPQRFVQAPLPVIAVPTTAGTGSEVTRNSVLTVPTLRVKRSLRDERLLPRLACIDPVLSAAAPLALRAACGFDALTHLIESFCSPRSTPATDALARAAIPRAWSALGALADGSATSGHAEDLAWASVMGGMCLANAGLGAAHGLVAPLGGLHPAAPHGAALACLLPTTLLVNDAALRARAPGHPAQARLAEIAAWITGANTSMATAAAQLAEVRRRCGLPGLAAYGVADPGPIVDAPSGSLKTNPLPLTRAELERIIIDALA